MSLNPKERKKLGRIWRVAVEIGFIVFLFYSNLLMGEFTRSNGHGKNLAIAIRDIFTADNFAIAIVCGLIGHLVFEYFREQF